MAAPSAALRSAIPFYSPAADIVALALAGAMSAQVATQANSQYQTEQDRKTMAAGLGRADRDAFEKPRDVVKAMGLRKGMEITQLHPGAIGPDRPAGQAAARIREPPKEL